MEEESESVSAIESESCSENEEESCAAKECLIENCTEDSINWIQCNKCRGWFHTFCCNIQKIPRSFFVLNASKIEFNFDAELWPHSHHVICTTLF